MTLEEQEGHSKHQRTRGWFQQQFSLFCLFVFCFCFCFLRTNKVVFVWKCFFKKNWLGSAPVHIEVNHSVWVCMIVCSLIVFFIYCNFIIFLKQCSPEESEDYDEKVWQRYNKLHFWKSKLGHWQIFQKRTATKSLHDVSGLQHVIEEVSHERH